MLRSELAHARRKLNAEIQRERDVVQRLRDLGEGNEIPEGYNDDFVMRARIQQIEEELQAERVRRQELERIVEDIRRECRTPFVVPAILEAFLEISELTNDVLEGIHVDG
ncbi:hypothetical protein FB45DRAFT_139839 [Roridomyces roridus]|uniref:Uncharacterized protein n=1 Tax=Roridomyces roridus TaxID=1738132 RepID=A0AAD7BI02_9AGAR|nr:hypothetical protein FB45DRAFT_139839 [Roridomyces roridus]